MANDLGTDGPKTGLPAAQELLPCPFCGAKAKNQGGNFHTGFWITCSKCASFVDPGKTEAETIAAWNRRAPQAAAVPGGVAPNTPSPDLLSENRRLREPTETALLAMARSIGLTTKQPNFMERAKQAHAAFVLAALGDTTP